MSTKLKCTPIFQIMFQLEKLKNGFPISPLLRSMSCITEILAIFRSWCDLHKQVCVSRSAGRLACWLAVRLARLKWELKDKKRCNFEQKKGAIFGKKGAKLGMMIRLYQPQLGIGLPACAELGTKIWKFFVQLGPKLNTKHAFNTTTPKQPTANNT